MLAMLTFDLHNATWEMYDLAHRVLQNMGGSRAILGDTGVWIALPETTVALESTYSAMQLVELAWRTLASAGIQVKRVAVCCNNVVAARSAG